MSDLYHSSSRHDRPTKHHVVIFVRQIVAVGHVVAREGPEAPKELHGLAGIQRDHVFLAGIVRVWIGAADAREHRMFFLVHMHRVYPASASIRYRPEFSCTTALR